MSGETRPSASRRGAALHSSHSLLSLALVCLRELRRTESSKVIGAVGSALCGTSQNMTELIAFRALQGLGGGGLMVLAMAVVGDLVPPRERGRYRACSAASSGSPRDRPAARRLLRRQPLVALDLLR